MTKKKILKDHEGQLLTGGNMNTPILKDHYVYKEMTEATPAVHQLLKHLRAKGIDWVPSSYVDREQGKHVLSYIEGIVPHDMPQWIWQTSILEEVAIKMREWHDATLDFDHKGLTWFNNNGQDHEVICHNDFAPYNCVFRDERLVGVIDFDVCSPGTRLWDLAYAAYRFVPLCPTENIEFYKECSPFTKSEMLDRLKGFLEAYSQGQVTTFYDLRTVIEKVQERLIALAKWSEAYGKAEGRPDILEHAKMYANHGAWLECLK